MTLNTDDWLAIYELIALHGHLMDAGEFERLGELFTDDFVYDVEALGAGNPLGHHVTNALVIADEDEVATVRSKGVGVAPPAHEWGGPAYDETGPVLGRDGRAVGPACGRYDPGLGAARGGPGGGDDRGCLRADERFANSAGVVQGGFLAAMLDDTLGPALVATLDAGQFAPTADLHVQFLAPARQGRLVGRGRVVRRGGRIAFLAGELVDAAGTVVAVASATAVIRDAQA